MKKLNFLLIALAMLISMPAMAQTRKEKKAAKKAQWEMEQEFKRKEAELIYQMRLDSIKAAQEDRQRAKEEAEREIAEQKQREKEEYEAAKAEEEYLKSMQTYDLPCYEPDTDEYYTAHVQRKMKVNQMTMQSTALLRLAQQQMRQKITAAYKAVVRDYMDQMDVDDQYSATSHIESAGEAVIQKFVNDTKESCRKSTRPDAAGYITLYLAIKVDKKELTEEIINNIPEKVKEEVRFNEEKFREQTAHHFNQVKE